MSNEAKYKEIANSKANKIAVVAGPGSGKTTGIIIPIAKDLISNLSIDPKQVLLLSFSRLSAIDLSQKVESLEKKPLAMTLHGFCLAFLMSENNHEIRKRIESVLLDFEKEHLISDIKLAFPSIHKRDIRKMLKEFSAGWTTENHEEVFNEDETHQKFKGFIVNWLDEYEASMMEEIVQSAVNLIREMKKQNVTSSFIEEPQYIFVDEFQDLNKLEQEFLKFLAENSKLLIIVGDPDQSIYSFKYAHPDGISDFSNQSDVEAHTLEYIHRSSKKVVELASKLLLQADPARMALKPLSGAIEGSITIKAENTQDEEFERIHQAINSKIARGMKPKDILVLFPKKNLCQEFVKFGTDKLESNSTFKYTLSTRIDFSDAERERVLLFSLIANPKSLLHIRTYLGLGDDNHFSSEISELKKKYGSLAGALEQASPDDFESVKTRIRRVCQKLVSLRKFLESHSGDSDVNSVIDELFPEDSQELSSLREEIKSLIQDGDTCATLYRKLVDYMRTRSGCPDEVRVMILFSSKGLDADTVYIGGCNAGNIPGNNRSVTLNDHEYKKEQRRLLYVGVTRAKNEVNISWSRNIPYEQAMGNYTEILSPVTINGKKHARVGLSEFLENLI